MDARVQALRDGRRRQYLVRGVVFAVMSGVCYGLYTGFLTLAETQGAWGAWFAGEEWGGGRPALSAFTITFVLAALAAGLNDTVSGLWSLLACARNRQLGDLWATVKTRPGWVMIACAAIGGPFATIAYVIALNSATAAGNPGVIVPIAALNCAIGAFLGKLLFHQRLQGHKVAGIAVCLFSAALIGGTSFAAMGPEALVGCLFAFLAAFGWGFEGCVAGFGTVLIDYRIGIAIRQITSGALSLFVAFPVLAAFGGGLGSIAELAGAAVANPAFLIFVVSGFFAMPAFSFWYKGNSMCGTALGMACNGMYAFWGPFFIWLIMGALNLGGLSADYPPLTAIQWAGALVMVAGIFCIAVDPTRLLRRGGGQPEFEGRPEGEPEGKPEASLAEGVEGDAPHAEGLDMPEAAVLGEEDAAAGALAVGTADASACGAKGCARAEGGAQSASAAQTESGALTSGGRKAAARDGRKTPLYYAILLHFAGGATDCAEGVVRALEPEYAGYKLLTCADVEEALATAKENALLDEVGCDLDGHGELRIRYRLSDFGREMIERYL